VIKANFKISENSLNEFIRVLLPEFLNYDIELNDVSTPDKKGVEVTIDGKKESFFYQGETPELIDTMLILSKGAILKLSKKNLAWGGLIGVRPTKLLRMLYTGGYSKEEAFKLFTKLYLVSPEKTKLLIDVVEKENQFLNRDHINVYIGIPYCPTKCKYCSFASYPISKGKIGKAYNEFVETLLDEISKSGKFLKENNYPIESVYIGGGTPSILTEKDLEDVLKTTRESIDFSKVKEFTFEAGRVDTLTNRKLELMKEYGVDRISLNPQTFNEEILKELNRTFDREKFDLMYEKAKELGLLINMDFIIGLPNESSDSIVNTFNEALNYDIDNLTIHVLALKRASTLYKEGQEPKEINLDVEKIYSKINEVISKNSLEPYYMYRQKNSPSWGENLGFAKIGTESIFNIEMIEENQSTFGIGGGAITKKIEEETKHRDKITRIVNAKEPIAYLKTIDEYLKKKFDLFKR